MLCDAQTTGMETRLVEAHLKRAKKWENLPKGWTDKSVQKFWGSMTGGEPVAKCIDKMAGKVDDPGAFCASLADKAKGSTDWRKGPRKKKQGFSELEMKWGSYLRTKEALDYVELGKIKIPSAKLLALATKGPQGYMERTMGKEVVWGEPLHLNFGITIPYFILHKPWKNSPMWLAGAVYVGAKAKGRDANVFVSGTKKLGTVQELSRSLGTTIKVPPPPRGI